MSTNPETAAPPPLTRVLETALYVDDLGAARRFYVDILGGTVLLDTSRLLALSMNTPSVLLLFQRGATSEPLPTPGGLVPAHGATGVQHVAFAIDAEALNAWRAHLVHQGVSIESEVRWERGGVSLYVRDPDGHSVEFATPGLWASY
jgi:catechol 2,3-dioxygenase-like lactoylglutathione lyase family enzyme